LRKQIGRANDKTQAQQADSSQEAVPTVSYTEAQGFAEKHLGRKKTVFEFDVPVGGWHASTRRFWLLCSCKRIDNSVDYREVQLDAEGCVLADRKVGTDRYSEIVRKLSGEA